MRRLLGQRANADPSDSSLGITNNPNTPSYRPVAAQDIVHNAGSPITCIDASQDGRVAVFAGRHILKVVSVDNLVVRDQLDLRAMISAQPATKHASTSSIADQFSIRDAKWATTQGKVTIFTGCASGNIFQYDLARLGAQDSIVQVREDSRQINTLDVNPHNPIYLLSGSQDGIVRLFDIRNPIHTKTGVTYRATKAFKCNAEGIRRVKWSSKDGFFFAAATDQGVVLKWDIRNARAPLLRINAHEKACSSISWHPDGDHLISGGWDSKCYVWDLSKNDRRQKPKYTISTPAPVCVVAWRPGLWSATAQGKRAAQVAISYDESSQKRHGISTVHIWDLARPAMPFKEIDRFKSAPGGLIWRDHDLLWTSGQDGIFAQCDVAFAPRVIDRLPMSTIAFSSRDDLAMFLNERPPTRPRHPVINAAQKPPTSSYSSSPTTQMLSISRSDSEDDVAGSFLGSRKRIYRQRRESTRSQLSTTPPDSRVMPLDIGIKSTGIFKSQQSMSIGHVPTSRRVSEFQYLTTVYLETLQRYLPHDGSSLSDRVVSIMDVYSKAAARMNLFRLAHTWKILGYVVMLLLQSRLDFHREAREIHLQKKKKAEEKKPDLASSGLLPGEETPRNPISVNGDKPTQSHRSLLTEEIDSTSNVTTPLARPVDDVASEYVPGKKLTPVLESEGFALPPAVDLAHHSERHQLGSARGSALGHESEASHVPSTEGYDFYDTEALSKAIDFPSSPAVNRLPSDFLPGSPESQRRPILRNDSTDSYGQLFSLSDGSRRTTDLTTTPEELLPRCGKHKDSRESLLSEYESRARGQELSRSPETKLRRASPDESNTSKEFLLASQTTTDSMFSGSRQSAAQIHAPPVVVDLPLFVIPPDEDDVGAVRDADYLPWHNDPPFPYPTRSETPSPFPLTINPYKLIKEALDFETRRSPLNAAAMVLLLKPLVPSSVITTNMGTAILRQYHRRLMGQRLFIEAALLRNLCVKNWSGIELWGEGYPVIFGSAQEHVKVGFYCSSCQKPREINHGSNSGPRPFVCDRCKAVMGPCAVCGHWQDTHNKLPQMPLKVAVTEALMNPRRVSADEPVLVTWWFCPTCGHGGHSTCLQGWHGPMLDEADVAHGRKAEDSGAGNEFSEGCCPMDGCGHACLPGKWRAEAITARTEEIGRQALEKNRVLGIITGQVPNTGSMPIGSGRLSMDGGAGLGIGFDGRGIRGDWNDVPQSRAVESVREAFSRDNFNSQSGHGSPSSGILSSSPGGGGMGRERRKSVKFVGDSKK